MSYAICRIILRVIPQQFLNAAVNGLLDILGEFLNISLHRNPSFSLPVSSLVLDRHLVFAPANS